MKPVSTQELPLIVEKYIKKKMNKAKILVADDIKQNVKLLRVILTASGFDVVEAYDGEEALEKLSQKIPT